jgi:hypothetical protein
MKRKAKPDFSLLLFDWKVHDRSMLRLAAAFLLTVGALIALCISFRIITPEPHSVITRPHQLLVLNPNIAAERALIHQAMDRSFPLLPADEGGSVAPANAVMPGFRPAIASYELKPKPITPGTTAAARPQFFALDIDVETPLPKPAPPPVVEQAPSVLRAVIEGEIASRSPEETTLAGIPLMEPTKPSFRVAVGPLGQVLMALPLYATEDVKVMAQLHDAVTALRFKPAKSEVEWGQISFRWEKEAKP